MSAHLTKTGRQILLASLILALSCVAEAQSDEPDIDQFFAAISLDPATAEAAQAEIAAAWRDGYASMLVDLLDILSRTGFVAT